MSVGLCGASQVRFRPSATVDEAAGARPSRSSGGHRLGALRLMDEGSSGVALACSSPHRNPRITAQCWRLPDGLVSPHGRQFSGRPVTVYQREMTTGWRRSDGRQSG